MKKAQLLLIGLSALTIAGYGQINKKQYYDYKQTRVMADYQVNSVGEKNGWFKGYDQQGILVMENNYKHNQYDGVCKEYTTVYGKREIAKSETYKEGVLNGPATYYGQNGLVLQQGNYMNGEKDGKWIILSPYSNYNIKDADKQGCDYIKSEVVYSAGTEVLNGKIKRYYYPNGKIRSEEEYANGKKVEQTWYYPNGKTEAYYKFDGLGEKYLIKKTYYANGQLWESGDWTSGKTVLEDFNEDGSPGTMSRYAQGEKKKERAKVVGDSSFLAGNYELAIKSYEGAGLEAKLPSSLYELENNLNSGTLSAKDAYYKLRDIKESNSYRYAEDNQKNVAKKKIDALGSSIDGLIQLDEKINAKWKEYLAAYTLSINNGSALDYPKGEHIYLKSRLVLDELIASYNKTVSLTEKTKAGNNLVSALDKLVVIANNGQYKDVNKKLKKVEDKAEIKTILGL